MPFQPASRFPPRPKIKLKQSSPTRVGRSLIGLLLVRLSSTAFAAALTVLGAGCRRTFEPLTPIQRGEVLYRSNCASCHGSDPRRPGVSGPAIAGSTPALLEARVLHRSYPSGYQPKRDTHLMQSMPWMAGKIGDLAAFLDSTSTGPRSVKAISDRLDSGE